MFGTLFFIFSARAQVYKGVIPDYADHVSQLCMGTCVALEVRSQVRTVCIEQRKQCIVIAKACVLLVVLWYCAEW